MGIRKVRDQKKEEKKEEVKEKPPEEKKKPFQKKESVKEETGKKKPLESIGLVGEGEIVTNFKNACSEKGYGYSTVLRKLLKMFAEDEIKVF